MKPVWSTKGSGNLEVFVSVIIALSFVAGASILYDSRLEVSQGLHDSASMYASYFWMNAKRLVR